MALFGLFGNDEEEQQAAPKKSFFGGIGNFLMGALKLALIAVAAIATLGLVFKNESAKNFVDGFTGGDGKGDGKGAASWITSLFDKGVGKVKEFLGISNTPTPDSLSETIKFGDRETMIPKKDKDSLLGDNLVVNSKARKDLGNREEAITEINNPKNLYTAQQKSVKFAELEELPAMSFALADKSVVWDAKAREVNAKNYGSGLPDVPVINLEARLPRIEGKFDELGQEKAGETWNSLSPVAKIKYLHNTIKESVANKPDLGKRDLQEDAGILSGSLREIFLPDRIISKEESSTIVKHVPIFSAIFQGKEHLTDKGIEITGKEKIGELLAKGDLDKALEISNGIQAKFLKTAEAVPAHIQNSDGSWIELNKDEKSRAEKQMLLYKNASESFGKISEYIQAKQVERDFEKEIANPMHKAVAETAANIPTLFNDFDQKLANFRAGRPVTPVASKDEQLSIALQKGVSSTKDSSHEVSNGSIVTPVATKIPPNFQGLAKQ